MVWLMSWMYEDQSDELIEQKLITETKKFMQTFHLEVCDQQQGEQVIKLVSDDKQQFYRVYRIYVRISEYD